jgi:hypothetical protein
MQVEDWNGRVLEHLSTSASNVFRVDGLWHVTWNVTVGSKRHAVMPAHGR